MRVLKFGGGCLKNPQELAQIILRIQEHLQSQQPLLVVFSAIDKTSAQLEEVADAYYAGDFAGANAKFSAIVEQHLDYAAEFGKNNPELARDLPQALLAVSDEFALILESKPEREYAYYYDQIVCLGELLATSLLSLLAKTYSQLPHLLLDTRDFLRSNAEFTRAKIDYAASAARITQELVPLLHRHKLVFLQGFIASTAENESTTLGKEGSDFSAALFADFLDAHAVYIYKDVPGVLDANPKCYPQAQTLSQLSYTQMAQIAKLGAQVIHPQTLSPLQSKAIPLYVLSFQNPKPNYTTISSQESRLQNPICIRQDHLLLVQFPALNPHTSESSWQILRQLAGYEPKFLQLEEELCCLILPAKTRSVLQELLTEQKIAAEILGDYSLISIIGEEELGKARYLKGLSWKLSWHREQLHRYLVHTRDLPRLEHRKL